MTVSMKPTTKAGQAWLEMLRDLFAEFSESGATPDDPELMICLVEREAARDERKRIRRQIADEGYSDDGTLLASRLDYILDEAAAR